MRIKHFFISMFGGLCFLPVCAQTNSINFMTFFMHKDAESTESSHSYLRQEKIKESITTLSAIIVQSQFQRNNGKGVDGDLLAEYAYALALHHDFEAALMSIDRARMVGTKYGDFYAAQVLTLMGYTDAAQQLMRQAKIAEWISGSYQELTGKYKTSASINRDAPEAALKRANKLAAN